MRRILIGVGLVVLALAIGGIVGHATAATPAFSGTYNSVPNDWFPSAVDTVCSHASWQDTVIPDGIHNYAVTVCTPSDENVAGVYVNLVPLGGPAASGWMLLRDEIGIWTWEGQYSAVYLRGAGDADSSVVHYQVWFLQQKNDN